MTSDPLAALTDLERIVFQLRTRHDPPIGWRQIAASLHRDTRTIRDAYDRALRKLANQEDAA